MLIREARQEDAEEIITVMKNAEESNFMLFSPGERKLEPKQLVVFIEKISKKFNSAIFIAKIETKIVGYLIVQGDTPSRIAHRAYIVIGIYSDFRGRGIGTALFSKLDDWAKGKGMHRLELTVLVDNTVGVALYKKMGFEIEGTKRQSLHVNGSYVDEYYMSKLL